jgi:phage terminase large subunit
VSYESALRGAQYDVTVVPNQGKGAAKARIEAGRRVFPACWFNEETTEAGREALGWYHEKKDEARNVGLGPDHDWSSHGADSFGLLAICAEQAFSNDARSSEPKGWRERLAMHNRTSSQAA